MVASREPIKIIVDRNKPDLSGEERIALQRFFREREKQAKHGQTETLHSHVEGTLYVISGQDAAEIVSQPNHPTLALARKHQTPLLLRQANGQYRIYGDTKGDGSWTFTSLENLGETDIQLLKKLPEKWVLKQGREDQPASPLFTSALDDVIKKAHTPRFYSFTDAEKEYAIEFVQPSFRRRKLYRKMVQCNVDNPLPEKNNREKSVLYLQERDGHVDVYTNQSDQPVSVLDAGQWAAVKLEWDTITRQAHQAASNAHRVYLMKNPEPPQNHFAASKPPQLYLYQEKNGRVFFVENEDGRGQQKFLDLEFSLPERLFNQPARSPKASELTELCKIFVGKAWRVAMKSPPDPKAASKEKMSVLMSACGAPVDRHLYQVRDEILGKGAFGEVSDSPGKWEHSEEGAVFVPYSQQHLRKQAQVFLMKTPEVVNPGELPVYEISDANTIYLYQKENGDVFHRIEGNDADFLDSLHTDEYRLDFSGEVFDGTKASPKTLETGQLKNALLEMISARGDLTLREEKVDRQGKAVKLQAIDAQQIEAGAKGVKRAQWEEREKLKGVIEENAVSAVLDKTMRDKGVLTEAKNTFSLMPKYPGKTLRDFLDQHRHTLTDQQLYDINVKLVEAVHEIHQQDKVHRDLKPANVMIFQDEKGNISSVTIIDRGLVAREYDKAWYAGTPLYVPPEISAVSDKLLVTREHDLYSLGVMMREVCQDQSFAAKKRALSSEKRKALSPDGVLTYQSLGYYLNISMADVTSPWLEGARLEKTQRDWLYYAMNGLTRTAADERVSTDTLLESIKTGKLPPNQNSTVIAENDFDSEKAAACFNDLIEEEKQSFFEEVSNQFNRLNAEVNQRPNDPRRNSVMAFAHVLRTAKQENNRYRENQAYDENSFYPDAEHSLPLILIMSRFLLEAGKKDCNLAELEAQHAALKDCLSNYGAFAKKAWNETFLLGVSREDRLKKTVIDHVLNFLGLPDANKITAGTITAYIFSLGFVLTPVRNAVKLVELGFKWISESLAYLQYKNTQTYPTSGAGKFLKEVTSGFLYLTHGLAEGTRLLVRTMTSPVTSFKEAYSINPLLGALSAACSAVALAGVVIVALPLLLPMVLPGVLPGITGWVAGSLPAVVLAKVSASIFAQIGFAVMCLLPITLNQLREGRLEKKPVEKNADENAQQSMKRSSSVSQSVTVSKSAESIVIRESTVRPTTPFRGAPPSLSSMRKAATRLAASSEGNKDAAAILHSVKSVDSPPASVDSSVDVNRQSGGPKEPAHSLENTPKEKPVTMDLSRRSTLKTR